MPKHIVFTGFPMFDARPDLNGDIVDWSKINTCAGNWHQGETFIIPDTRDLYGEIMTKLLWFLFDDE